MSSVLTLICAELFDILVSTFCFSSLTIGFIFSFKALYIPFNIINNPIPPASTTFASFNAGSMSGVLLRTFSLCSHTFSNSCTMSLSLEFVALSPAAFIIVKIVPSVGLITALYANFAPSCILCANAIASASSFPSNPFDIPLKI
ncbi:hypothetical protein SDC9_158106 [bioreactor metagenome]|uniref:Uncharacterized protein n=1 Tax=bioreactor metagenome TaxID=1076179 RepID=A0A645FBU3_9ZZZZ